MINKNLIRTAKYTILIIGVCTTLIGLYRYDTLYSVDTLSIVVGIIMTIGAIDLMIEVKEK